jgi:WD40 repeat protein
LVCEIPEGDHRRAVSPDGKALAIGSGSGIKVYDPNTGAVLQSLAGPEKGGVSALAWSADGQTLAAAGGRSIDLWEMPSGRQAAHYMSPDLDS